MPKFASQRLTFGAVGNIFRGEAESGLKILTRFLVKIWIFFRGRAGQEDLVKGRGKNFQKNVQDFFARKGGFYIAKGAEILEAS